MRIAAAAVLALILLSGCDGQDREGLIPGSTTTVGAGTGTATTTTTIPPLVAGCPEEGQFVESGSIIDLESASSDTGIIGAITWDESEACETFEIAFETVEGAPATTPPSIQAGFLEDVGVIRVRLSATDTVITDQLVETDLVERIYVVRGLDGAMFVDLHLAAPAQARLFTTVSPAMATLQLQPGILELPGDAPASGPVVVTAPPEDAEVQLALTVEGYASTAGSDVLIIATRGGEVIAEERAAPAEGTDTWAQFSAQVELGPGPASLFVGDDTEGLQGVSIEVTAR